MARVLFGRRMRTAFLNRFPMRDHANAGGRICSVNLLAEVEQKAFRSDAGKSPEQDAKPITLHINNVIY
ncbi:MAG: hypothetical protein H6881_10700 [Rhodobiaceae bacterium]|nr:hypothetical protein [Hoeflea sp.]MCC0052335.1 hypothetical protein [Rhodobiaceae bacterium]